MAQWITNDWATGILLAVAAQNLILAAAMVGARTNRASDLRLAALLCVLAFKGAPYCFGWRGHAEAPDWLAFFPLNAPLAIGPLLYSYIFARTNGRPPRREWLHLVPPLIDFIYCCACLLLPETLRHGWKESWHDHFAKPLLEFAFAVSLIAYTALSLRLTRQLRERWVQERSDADRQKLTLLVVTVAIMALAAIGYAWIFVYSNWIAEIDLGAYFLWTALVSVGLALEGWRATGLAPLPLVASKPLGERKAHDWKALGECWREKIESEGWWREPELSLVQLSRRLGVNATYLSRAINEGLGVNFNELINSMRAGDVARRIAAGDVEDLLTMAFDAGFSSKATFNRAFQARLGLSPGAYRRGLKS